MKLPNRFKNRGICLVGALILFLLALLAAGFVFYAGRCIIDWLNDLGYKHDEQIRNASEFGTNEVSTVRVEFLPMMASK